MALSLLAASGLVWSEPRPYQPDRRVIAHHREMLAPFAVEVDEDRLQRSANVGFPHLAKAALERLSPPVTEPDLLILAHGLPDIYPLKSTTAYLNHLLGGHSRTFAVTEQGLRAPFTALRIADAYNRAERYADVALFVCDQTTLPYHDSLVHDTPLADSAVLLYFGTSADGWFQYGGTASGSAGADPEAVIKPYLSHADPERTLLVAGSWLSDPITSIAPHVHRVPPGTYCTGPWLDLARHHEIWARQFDAIVLCDTDPRTGRSQAALLHRTPSGPGGAGR
jgi:hypothetical protein